MWFQYFDDPRTSPVPIDLEDVRNIMEMNARGEKPDDLQKFAIQEEAAPEDALYGDVVGQDDVNRFDNKGRQKSKGGRGRSRKGNGQPQGTSNGKSPSNQSGGGGKRRNNRRKGRGSAPKA